MVAIFTRSITDDLTSLVKQIDDQVAQNEDKKMASFVILLSNDPDADEAKLLGQALTALRFRFATGKPT